MKEDFLHYIWNNGFFRTKELKTTQNQHVKIISRGFHNTNAGPDFLEAKIMIDEILWVGNVEIHKSSSDWYAHGHEKNPAYDNIILHVVYEDNMPIYNVNNVQVPSLVLSKYIYQNIVKNYTKLLKNKAIIRCQNDISNVNNLTILNYKYKLYFERLEHKYTIVKNMLNHSNNNWEQVLFETLLKYFGGVVNKDAFELLSKYISYEILKKHKNSVFQLEALLFGISGFLEEKINDAYYQSLQKEFIFLKTKYELEILPNNIIKFHRLRPLNFPTIRLAQFAQLYHQTDHLFEKLMRIKKPEETYKLFEIEAGNYWNTHYNFSKQTKKKVKKIGANFIDIIIINVIVPLKFSYQKYHGTYNNEEIIKLIESIKPEKNSIINIFNKVNLIAGNALDSQAIIQLNENYCRKNKCLQCEIGHSILKKELKNETREN